MCSYIYITHNPSLHPSTYPPTHNTKEHHTLTHSPTHFPHLPTHTHNTKNNKIQKADIVLVVGARLNWILHFGDAPRWNPQAKFLLVDVEQVGL